MSQSHVACRRPVFHSVVNKQESGARRVISMYEIYSIKIGHFINTNFDSCQILSFAYFRINMKKDTKGLIWSTPITDNNTN